MAKILFKNPHSGETKKVKLGWSWTLFLFSGILGLPLFMRKLHSFGIVFLTLWVANFLVGNVLTMSDDNRLEAYAALFIVDAGLSIWLAIKGNEMTAKNYLDLGWKLVEPDPILAQRARYIWNLSEPVAASAAPVT